VLASLRSTLVVLGRWPRRLAAAACLLLAAGAALTPSPRAAARCMAASARWPRLPPGSVAVPITVTATGSDLIERGTHVGLVPGADETGVSGPASGLIADHLLVLRPPTGGADRSAVLLVAVRRADLPRLAPHLGRPLLALIDPP
jgi:hypothetical protein